MCFEEALRASVESSMGLLFLQKVTSLVGPLGPRTAPGKLLVSQRCLCYQLGCLSRSREASVASQQKVRSGHDWAPYRQLQLCSGSTSDDEQLCFHTVPAHESCERCPVTTCEKPCPESL